jgi:hypothetical protein
VLAAAAGKPDPKAAAPKVTATVRRLVFPLALAMVRPCRSATAQALCCSASHERVEPHSGEPGGDALLGGGVGQVEHQLIKPRYRMPRVGQTDDFQVNRAAGQAKNRPVQAVAAVEGFQNRQPDNVPVEADRLLVVRAPAHHPQRTHGKMLWPARPP